MQAKKAVIKLILYCAPLLMLVAFVNFKIDPSHLFANENFEKGIATILLNDSNVTNLTNYDERLVIKNYAERLTERKKTLVIGSSRSLSISADMTGSSVFFNCSVSGASLEDDYAVYQLFRKRNLLPDTLILCLDPWLLNENSGQVRWKSIGKEYYELATSLQADKAPLFYSLTENMNKLKELFSFGYFQASIKDYLSGAYKRGNYYATKEVPDAYNTKLPDGSLLYNSGYKNKTEREKEFEINSLLKNKLYSLSGFGSISKKNTRLLESLVKAVKTDKVHLLFFLSPYHPLYYDYLKKNEAYKVAVSTEAFYKNFAAQQGVPLKGSYDPAQFAFTGQDFYDEMHLKETPLKKIFSRNSN